MPASNLSPQPTGLGRLLAKGVDYATFYAVELFLIALILYLCVSKGMTVGIDIYDPANTTAAAAPAVREAGLGSDNVLSGLAERGLAFLTTVVRGEDAGAVPPTTPPDGSTPTGALLTSAPAAAPTERGYDDFNDVVHTDDPAPHMSNLTLVLSPDYGERKGLDPAIITAKKKRVTDYIDRYAAIAQREMRDFGIPASITLAQGLLESNAGDSKLAVRSNNHFGIKCRRKCLGCTCRNYSDDTRYDMFRVFDSVAESFREHSELLNTKRYAKLKQHGTDYKKWAHGLKACGYATDKKYGHKLVKIIENLGLDRYDG